MCHLLHWALFGLTLGGSLTAGERPREAAAPPDLPPGVRALRDLEYGRVGDRTLRLDLYLPDGETSRPLVIWIHGGAWRNGNKNNCPALFLTRDGYAVASIGYRLSGEALWPAPLLDCQQAVRWLRQHATEYRLDADRFGVWGASAGGHLAALLGVAHDAFETGRSPISSRVQAVVDFYGPTDFLRLNDRPGALDHNAADSPESQLLGAPIQTVPERCREASPLTYVTGDDPPFLIAHGDQDPLVPLNQSELLRDALTAAEVSVEYHVVAGAGHGLAGREVVELVRDFLARHLRGGEAAPPRPGRPGASPGAGFLDLDRTEPPLLRYVTYPSPAAGGLASCLVYLPPSYIGETEKNYAVLLWLHGTGGNQRSGAEFVRRADAAIRAGLAPEMIIVLVNSPPTSLYVDARDGSSPGESVLVDDLIPFLEATYRTRRDRSGRGLEGCGTGGLGALRLAFAHPDRFAAASSLAGDLMALEELPRTRPAEFQRLFAGDAEALRRATPSDLAERHAARIGRRVAVRLAVGDQDPAAGGNERMHARLAELGIPHQYALLPGVGGDYPDVYEALGDAAWRFWAEVFGRL